MPEKRGFKPMMKTFSFFGAIFIISSYLLSISVGSGGMTSTQLNGGITATATTIVVDNCSTFYSNGYIVIGGEIIQYGTKTGTTQFNITQRGAKGTTAAAHLDNAIVYSEDNGVINNIFNFNIGSLFNQWGIFAVPMAVKQFFTVTIPYLSQSNMFMLFQGDLAILATLWMAFPLGFIAMLIMWVLNLIRGN